jgi:glyoxylase-like metal-dependent hydrolase (beta-lactamase superfamily II)
MIRAFYDRAAGRTSPQPMLKIWFAAALALLLGTAAIVQAKAPKAGFQTPGFFRTQVGDLEVTSLADNVFAMPPTLLKGDQTQITDLIAKDFPTDPPKFDGSIAGFLINTGQQLILVDTGTGHFGGMPKPGRLVENLRKAGYTPEQVDLILITHMHFDHVGGLVTPEGKRVFPNATVRMSQAESDFWLSKDNATKAPEGMQNFFKWARLAAAPYQAAGRWKPFTGTDELAPGVKPVPLVGHTPGHSGYEFDSGDQRILAWGDTLHIAPVQFPHPEVGIGFDSDGAQAIDQRTKLFAALADSRTIVLAPHVGYPSIGRVEKADVGYAWVPLHFKPMP